MTRGSKFGLTPMSDRSQEVAKKFKAKKEAEQLAEKEENIKNAEILRDHETLQREALKIWDNVRDEFRRQMQELNAEPEIGNILTLDDKVLNAFTVERNDEHRVLRVSYNYRDYEITFASFFTPVGACGKLRIKISKRDSEPTVIDENGRRVDIATVVDSYLQSLLGLG